MPRACSATAAIAPQDDVELVHTLIAATVGPRDQHAAWFRWNPLENGMLGGGRLIREVQPGDRVVQQAAAKTVTRMCGACMCPSGPGTRPGLMVSNQKRPSSSVSARRSQ
jgi:hypothetical protein